MTTGFVVFGLGEAAYALALRVAVDGPAWIAAAGTAACTLAIALLPLDRSAAIDDAHGVFALFGYASLVAVPLLAAPAWRRSAARHPPGRRGSSGCARRRCWRRTSIGPVHGLFQRAGLAVTDVWIVASSVALLRWRPRR